MLNRGFGFLWHSTAFHNNNVEDKNLGRRACHGLKAHALCTVVLKARLPAQLGDSKPRYCRPLPPVSKKDQQPDSCIQAQGLRFHRDISILPVTPPTPCQTPFAAFHTMASDRGSAAHDEAWSFIVIPEGFINGSNGGTWLL